VHAYDASGTTASIRRTRHRSTVSYDTTRNEFDPQYAWWRTGSPASPACPSTSTPRSPAGPMPARRAAAAGPVVRARLRRLVCQGCLLNTYVTETWERPTGCVARNVNGDPLINGVDEQVLPIGSDTPGNNKACLEGRCWRTVGSIS